MQTLSLVELVPLLVSLVCGVAIPSVVDLVTHSTAPWWLKSGFATVLSALAGALTTVAWQPDVNWKVYVFNVFAAFLATFTSHHAGSSQVVQDVTGSFGVGKRASLAVAGRGGFVPVVGPEVHVRSERVSMAVPQRLDGVSLPVQGRHEGPVVNPGGVGLEDVPPVGE